MIEDSGEWTTKFVDVFHAPFCCWCCCRRSRESELIVNRLVAERMHVHVLCGSANEICLSVPWCVWCHSECSIGGLVCSWRWYRECQVVSLTPELNEHQLSAVTKSVANEGEPTVVLEMIETTRPNHTLQLLLMNQFALGYSSLRFTVPGEDMQIGKIALSTSIHDRDLILHIWWIMFGCLLFVWETKRNVALTRFNLFCSRSVPSRRKQYASNKPVDLLHRINNTHAHQIKF